MQIIRLLSILLAIIFVQGCATYTSEQEARAINLPELGSIIQTRGNFWYATSERVGTPEWGTPLVVDVQEVPFTKNTYGNYSAYMGKASRINGIAYVDSLPYKPKYLRLQLADKIAVVQQLNSTKNGPVRDYLATDHDYKVVTSLDITLTDALMPKFLSAAKVTLCENAQWGKHLLFIIDKKEERVPFSEIQVFDYSYASLCWGEDRYHNKRVETLLPGNNACPKGTYKKAAKVGSDKSYLKF
ncbi:MAG: hypothetical protein ABJN95_05615 [Maribacter sp.]|uniref:hypothetical protein n=1 Tax=Maribacter sp. TaxID=1897614 RepID=UPI00329916DA